MHSHFKYSRLVHVDCHITLILHDCHITLISHDLTQLSHDLTQLSHDLTQLSIMTIVTVPCSLLQHSSHFEVTGDGVEVEGVTMKYFYETAVIGGVIR